MGRGHGVELGEPARGASKLVGRPKDEGGLSPPTWCSSASRGPMQAWCSLVSLHHAAWSLYASLVSLQSSALLSARGSLLHPYWLLAAATHSRFKR